MIPFVKLLKSLKISASIFAVCTLLILAHPFTTRASTYGSGSFGQCTYQTSIKGDLNHDCHVNILDVSIMIANYNKSGAGLLGDLNGDNTVNIFDVSIMISNYGK
jgi:hypothetical protein